MKPLFTVHAGEYLVGAFLEKTFKRANVWIPLKDTGVDLMALRASVGSSAFGLAGDVPDLGVAVVLNGICPLQIPKGRHAVKHNVRAAQLHAIARRRLSDCSPR